MIAMPMPTLSDQELVETRRDYAAAALALYREGGVRAVTMRAVADRLSVSHTLVYRYFSSKSGLLASARGLCFDALRETIRDAVTATRGNAEAKLVVLIQSDVAWTLSNLADYRLMFMVEHDPVATAPDFDAALQRLGETCIEVISAYLAEAGRDDDPAMLCNLGWAGIHGVVMLEDAGHLTGEASAECMLQPMLQSVYRMKIPLKPVFARVRAASGQDISKNQSTDNKAARATPARTGQAKATKANGAATGRRKQDGPKAQGAPPRRRGISGRRRSAADL